MHDRGRVSSAALPDLQSASLGRRTWCRYTILSGWLLIVRSWQEASSNGWSRTGSGTDRAVAPGRRLAGRVDARGSTIAPRWKGSCSCSTPVVAGGTYPRSWAADPGTPRGVVCACGRTRRLGPAAPTRARRALRRAAVGLVAGLYRRGVGAVEKGRELTGPNPTGRHVVGLTGPAGRAAHTLPSPMQPTGPDGGRSG
jgi:hypothetical protein